MYPFKVSVWPSAKATSARQRKDININSFNDLFNLVSSPKPFYNKIDQNILTRCYQETRSRENTVFTPPYLITLDYDSTEVTYQEVHNKLNDLDICHFIFTTWTHKTIETPQKRNNGKNCFKVVVNCFANNKDELFLMTKGLGAIVEKYDINKSDDISAGIFIGGVHPEFREEFNATILYNNIQGEELKDLLLASVPHEPELTKDPVDDFEMWDKTIGQKYKPERIKQALSVIKYEEIEGFTKMSVWYSIGYALHSTGEDDFFEVWDDWCLENCAEHGVYNREENEKFWAKQTVPKEHKNLCTLSTLWHLEKLFKARETNSEIRQSSWNFFDTLAKEEPEEVRFLIKDLLVEDSIGFLVGSGGVGKSSLCLEIAKSISSGLPFFNDSRYETIQGTVAIINKEDSLVKIHNQIHNLVELDIDRMTRGAVSDFSDEQIILTDKQVEEVKDRWTNVARPQWAQSSIRLTNQDGEDLEKLGVVIASLKTLQEELIETNRPPLKLVIFDPMNMFQGGDQNNQRDMSFMFSAFQQIQRQLGTAVLIVHHMNKSKGFSGSHTIRDSGRFMWYLRNKIMNKEESDRFIEFYVEKNNDAKANYTALDFIRTDKGLLDKANLAEDNDDEN